MKQRLKTKEKNKETKNAFFEKKNKIDKTLAKTHQENRERTQSEKIRNENQEKSPLNTTGTRRLIRHNSDNSAPVTGRVLS